MEANASFLIYKSALQVQCTVERVSPHGQGERDGKDHADLTGRQYQSTYTQARAVRAAPPRSPLQRVAASNNCAQILLPAANACPRRTMPQTGGTNRPRAFSQHGDAIGRACENSRRRQAHGRASKLSVGAQRAQQSRSRALGHVLRSLDDGAIGQRGLDGR